MSDVWDAPISFRSLQVLPSVTIDIRDIVDEVGGPARGRWAYVTLDARLWEEVLMALRYKVERVPVRAARRR